MNAAFDCNFAHRRLCLPHLLHDFWRICALDHQRTAQAILQFGGVRTVNSVQFSFRLTADHLLQVVFSHRSANVDLVLAVASCRELRSSLSSRRLGYTDIEAHCAYQLN
jgi:hypothetical protein